MRLAEDKIIAGILHPEQPVRDVAVAYFSGSYGDNRAIMAEAIKAVETYGWQRAFTNIEVLQPLVQTDHSVSWLVSEFDRLGDSSNRQQWEYLTALSWILADADAGLLKRRRDDVLGIRLLDAEAREAIETRTRLLTAKADACWQELEEFCARIEGGQAEKDLSIDRAFYVVEAISRHADDYSDRVLSILAQDVDPTKDLPRAWLQLLMIRAAGRMRLQDAIPNIIAKLQRQNPDWVQEECVQALTRIGGEGVIKAVWNACALADEHFVSFASWVLESIHIDLAEEAALHLFQQTEDITDKVNLAYAVLAHFTIDGLAPVRHLIINAAEDEQILDLRDHLLAVCTLMQAELPELESWRQQLQQQQSYHPEWQSPEFPVVDAWDPQPSSTAKPRQDGSPPPLRFPKNPSQRVGRNDPCPCNSGKKYKNCCLRRSG